MEQKEDDSRSAFVVIIHTVLLAVTVVLSLVGNSLVSLAFYRNRRLRTITNFYVLSIAVADIMVATFDLPFNTVASGLRSWPFNYNFCQFSGFISVYWATVSLCIMALTSMNRYFCVVKPQRYPVFFTKKKTIISILSVWIFLFVFYLTFNSAVYAYYRWEPNELFCRVHYRDEGTEKVSFVTLACFSFVSMSLVLFGYGSVYRVVRQHNRDIVPSLQNAANNQGAIRAQEIKTSRVLFATVFGFCVSWIPSIAITFFEVSTSSITQSAIPLLFASISVWINPLIYGVMNRAMRKEFQNILVCQKGN